MENWHIVIFVILGLSLMSTGLILSACVMAARMHRLHPAEAESAAPNYTLEPVDAL